MLGGSGCQGKRSCQEKPGGDDGDAHTADQSESSPLVRHPSHPASIQSPLVRNSPATHGRQASMTRDCARLELKVGPTLLIIFFKSLSVETYCPVW